MKVIDEYIRWIVAAGSWGSSRPSCASMRSVQIAEPMAEPTEEPRDDQRDKSDITVARSSWGTEA